jgi:hypothetical protein
LYLFLSVDESVEKQRKTIPGIAIGVNDIFAIPYFP